MDTANSTFEEAFVNEILSNNAVSKLVDEMFWGHDVNFEPLYPVNGTQYVPLCVSCVETACRGSSE